MRIYLVGKNLKKTRQAPILFGNREVLIVDQQIKLITSFTAKEVKVFLFLIDSTKIPEPDEYGEGSLKLHGV